MPTNYFTRNVRLHLFVSYQVFVKAHIVCSKHFLKIVKQFLLFLQRAKCVASLHQFTGPAL